jgi:hypothetical protein
MERNGRRPVTCPLHNHKSPNSTSDSVEPSGLLSVGTALATLACSLYVSFDAGGACVSTTHQSPWASARPVALWSVTVAAYTPVPSSTEIETSTSASGGAPSPHTLAAEPGESEAASTIELAL